MFGCASVNVPIVLSTSSHNRASITGRRGCCSAALAPAVAMPELAEVTFKYLRSAYIARIPDSSCTQGYRTQLLSRSLHFTV